MSSGIVMRPILAVFLLFATPALAQERAGSDQIRAAIAGHTVTGTMDASGAYAEFYDKDGSIRAADYAGRWQIKGDQMCFDYDDGPTRCWGAVLSGSQVIWIGAAGEEGSGRISAGNPGGW